MAGRTASNTVTRYAGIQVQTSSMGVQIPVGWGTFRCKCNLVDYLDFKSKAQKAASGKGGSTTTGYSYSATIILAICEGSVDAISTVYVDGKIYVYNSPYSSNANTGSTSALTQAGLSWSGGAIGQSVWSYLTTAHPSHAIGYSGLTIAYAENYALDSGASTPNHSFEVVRTASFGVSGTPDADPSLVVADFFTNPRTGVPSWGAGLISASALSQYQDYCLAAGLLVSPVIDSQRSASDFLNELLLATNSTCVWSEGLLKFIPYGDTPLSGNGKTYAPDITPVYSLSDDDYVVDNPGDPPLQVDIEDQSDAYNVVQLEYLDRTNQYNMAIALASDAANIAQYGMRRKDPDTVHCICTPAVAAVSAQLWLQRTLYVRAQYKFKLGWMFAVLEPGDIVELTDSGLGLSAYPVRIIQIDEDEKYGLTITAEDAQIGVANAPLYTMQTSVASASNAASDPGGVETNLLLWSQDFTQSAWGKADCTVAGGIVDPFGGTAADAITRTAVGNDYVWQAVGALNAAGANVVAGVWLQAGTGTGAINLYLKDGAGNTYGLTNYTPTSTWTFVTVAAAFPDSAASGVAFYVDPANDVGVAGDTYLVCAAQMNVGVALAPYAQTTSAMAAPVIFNPPSVLNSSGASAWAAAAGGPNWGGANVWVSTDGGDNYEQVGVIDAPARYGVLTAGYPAGSDPDTTDTLAVDLRASAGALSSAAAATADNGGTLCLIDSELIAFSAATLTSAYNYDLTGYVRRGYLNSGVAAHAAGATFVRLDSAIFDFPYFATNAGQSLYIKFQSFNLWGAATQSLENCLAYGFTPGPVGASAPGSSAWSAVGGVLSNGGQSVPAIEITGASDNPSAQAVIFYYRVTGTGSGGWISGGQHANTITAFNVTAVTPSQTYDVGVAYLVNGVVGAITVFASAITVGTVSTGSGGVAPGSTILQTSVAGNGSITLPAGSYGNATITVIGASGGCFEVLNHGTGKYYAAYGGGGPGSAQKTIAVTPGSTVVTYDLGAAGTDGVLSTNGTAGGNSTATATGLSLAVSGGAGATAIANGAGGVGSGGSADTTGATGGMTTIGGARNGSITITAET